MRRDLAVAPARCAVLTFSRSFRLVRRSSSRQSISTGAFVGLADVAAIHAETNEQSPEADTATLQQSLKYNDVWVEARTRFDHLMPLFESRQAELLVVVDDQTTKRVVGLITEAFALRRYRQELEARQREMFGW